MKRLTIVVGGYIVAYPLGGMTWHHLNYLLGLHAMGHEVYFLEDSGSYSYPYNPVTQTMGVDSSYGRAYMERTFAEYGLPPRYCYYSEFENTFYGMTGDDLFNVLQRADLLLCVSGVTPMRPDRTRPRRAAVIDTDPVFTQLRMMHDAEFRAYYDLFDSVATFGRLIGTPECPLPTHDIDWIPTCQPIALKHWPVEPPTSRAFSTIGKWEHSADRNLEFQGRRFHSSKGVEWLKLINLPSQVPWEMTLGMLAMPSDVAQRFTAAGWHLLDAQAATISCRSYADFIRNSAGEFTVAKEIYAGLPSGWFSDRSAAYLASGRPVVTQATGFDRWLPTGEGLFSYSTQDQAVVALHSINADLARHSAAARAIAEENFDSKKVLEDLIDRVM